MKQSEIIKKQIRHFLYDIVEGFGAPAPVKPDTDTKEKERTKKPNPFQPPKEAPKTRPKGYYLEEDEDDDILDKITKRFVKLKNERFFKP